MLSLILNKIAYILKIRILYVMVLFLSLFPQNIKANFLEFLQPNSNELFAGYLRYTNKQINEQANKEESLVSIGFIIKNQELTNSTKTRKYQESLHSLKGIVLDVTTHLDELNYIFVGAELQYLTSTYEYQVITDTSYSKESKEVENYNAGLVFGLDFSILRFYYYLGYTNIDNYYLLDNTKLQGYESGLFGTFRFTKNLSFSAGVTDLKLKEKGQDGYDYKGENTVVKIKIDF